MAEQSLPISRQQSDAIDMLNGQIRALNHELSTMLRIIVAGHRELPRVGERIEWETYNKDGVYTLVLKNLPDPAPVPPVKRSRRAAKRKTARA